MDEEVRARNSRRVSVAYPHFVRECTKRGALVTRKQDQEGALLLFDCSKLVAQEQERAELYSDRELLDVDDYTVYCKGAYDPDDPDALATVKREQNEQKQRRKRAKARAMKQRQKGAKSKRGK